MTLRLQESRSTEKESSATLEQWRDIKKEWSNGLAPPSARQNKTTVTPAIHLHRWLPCPFAALRWSDMPPATPALPRKVIEPADRDRNS